MRILIVTPVFPFPERGADQYERAGNIRQLLRLGHEVSVITKVGSHVDLTYVKNVADELGIKIQPVQYRRTGQKGVAGLLYQLGKLRNPLYLDGAAYEYAEPVIQQAVAAEIERFTPDIVWFDYTYLWPLYHLARKKRIPIITRSINFEPTHFLEEDGRSLLNYLKYVPKLLSELIVIRKSSAIVALSPHEAGVYRLRGAKEVSVVPLRGLPNVLRDHHEIRSTRPLHVFFMGSTYTVEHNARSLDFVTGYLASRAEREYPGEFVFHISGAKVPQKYLDRFDGKRVIYEGYLDLDAFDEYLDRMDIAVSPSRKEVGMQQKVYEPLCRGIPLITDPVNTGGYPFEDGKHYEAAGTPEEYFRKLVELRDPQLRAARSKNAAMLSRELFSQDAIDASVREVLRKHSRQHQ